MNNKLIVILGPTASGKSNLAVKLAKKFNGEVISADSRQVYRGFNIGSGKITKKEMQGVPHHLLDIANPKRRFTVAQFQKLTFKKIIEIQKRGKTPFLVGGTGFYIQSVVDNLVIPEVKPNWKLRRKLERKTTEELFLMLKKLDPSRAKTIDAKNPRRLIRALEIVKSTGKPIPQLDRRPTSIQLDGRRASKEFDVLQIGIKKSPEELRKSIQKRLLKRLKKGLVNEVNKLHRNSISWKRLEELGLEYRFVAQYIQGKLSYQEMIDRIQKESEHFVKRQTTWFKKDSRIKWVSNNKEAENLIRKFFNI